MCAVIAYFYIFKNNVMETNYRNTNIDKIGFATVTGENKLLRAAFSWMALAMVLTAVASLVFYFVP